ncbi:MAG: hypothetical protein ACOY99_04790 [Pseudomonadota bacterium]
MKYSINISRILLIGAGLIMALGSASSENRASLGPLETDEALLILCRAMVRHVPEEGVVYAPGRDVEGRAVAPAEVAPPAVAIPSRLAIPVTVDLARRLGLSVGEGVLDEALLGIISVTGGVATFNGQPLDPANREALGLVCDAVPAGD